MQYVRGKKTGEQRLASKGSIGIGGHLNDRDENLFSFDQSAYLTGVRREVDEELILQSGYQNHIRALLNADTTEVGRVHLAPNARSGSPRWRSFLPPNCTRAATGSKPGLRFAWTAWSTCSDPARSVDPTGR